MNPTTTAAQFLTSEYCPLMAKTAVDEAFERVLGLLGHDSPDLSELEVRRWLKVVNTRVFNTPGLEHHYRALAFIWLGWHGEAIEQSRLAMLYAKPGESYDLLLIENHAKMLVRAGRYRECVEWTIDKMQRPGAEAAYVGGLAASLCLALCHLKHFDDADAVADEYFAEASQDTIGIGIGIRFQFIEPLIALGRLKEAMRTLAAEALANSGESQGNRSVVDVLRDHRESLRHQFARIPSILDAMAEYVAFEEARAVEDDSPDDGEAPYSEPQWAKEMRGRAARETLKDELTT